MFDLIKKIFMKLLISIVIASKNTNCVSLSNQKCITHPTLKLDRCAGSCSTLNDLSNKACDPDETEDLNLSLFNMITGINESETLIKHISCKCK